MYDVIAAMLAAPPSVQDGADGAVGTQLPRAAPPHQHHKRPQVRMVLSGECRVGWKNSSLMVVYATTVPVAERTPVTTLMRGVAGPLALP